MSWKNEIPIIVRVWINDLSETPTYSDDRLEQLIAVAAQYVKREINFSNTYTIDTVKLTITPDPTQLESPDQDFIGFVALKAACLLDQSTFRTKAASEGIRAALGPASLSVGGNLKGYQTILEMGPCAMYQDLRLQYEIGNANGIKSILSPFVGNKFDPSAIRYSSDRSRDFYS